MANPPMRVTGSVVAVLLFILALCLLLAALMEVMR